MKLTNAELSHQAGAALFPGRGCLSEGRSLAPWSPSPRHCAPFRGSLGACSPLEALDLTRLKTNRGCKTCIYDGGA